MESADGEVRPANGQVHGRLPALPRRRGAQGGQRLHRQAQGNEVHPIRRLVRERFLAVVAHLKV